MTLEFQPGSCVTLPDGMRAICMTQENQDCNMCVLRDIPCDDFLCKKEERKDGENVCFQPLDGKESMGIKKKLYFEVGTIIELHDGSHARLTENDDYMRCEACVLNQKLCGAIACYHGDRKDGREVYFELIDEGGKA